MLRVAIIDDDEKEAKYIEGLVDFKALGLIYIGTAPDGESGFRLIEDAKADIIITDIVMPKVNGIELIKRIRLDVRRPVEIIVMTGYRKFDYAMEMLKYRVSGLYVKPLKSEELEMALIESSRKLRRIDTIDNVCRIVKEEDVENDNFVAKAITYLDKHCKEKLTLASVASDLYVSSWHLCKLFRRYTGKTFVDVLNIIRIAKAREFLKESRLKVNEIATRVGFRDIAYFTVLFKKVTGVTPLKYRNNHAIAISMNLDGGQVLMRYTEVADAIEAERQIALRKEQEKKERLRLQAEKKAK